MKRTSLIYNIAYKGTTITSVRPALFVCRRIGFIEINSKIFTMLLLLKARRRLINIEHYIGMVDTVLSLQIHTRDTVMSRL